MASWGAESKILKNSKWPPLPVNFFKISDFDEILYLRVSKDGGFKKFKNFKMAATSGKISTFSDFNQIFYLRVLNDGKFRRVKKNLTPPPKKNLTSKKKTKKNLKKLCKINIYVYMKET